MAYEGERARYGMGAGRFWDGCVPGRLIRITLRLFFAVGRDYSAVAEWKPVQGTEAGMMAPTKAVQRPEWL